MPSSTSRWSSKQLIQVVLVVLAGLWGTIEPIGQAPERILSVRSSSDHSALPAFGVAYDLTGRDSDTTRARKPHCGLDGPPRFDDRGDAHQGVIAKAASIAGNNRRSLHLYMRMDHPAGSPGRWRC